MPTLSLLRSGSKCLPFLLITLTPNLLLAQRLMEDFKPVIKGAPYFYSVEFDTDGKIYFAGRFTTVGGDYANTFVRINSDGSLDNTFKTPENVYYAPSDIIASRDSIILVVQPNREMLVLKKDGTVETSFVQDPAIRSVFAAALIGGKYLVAARLWTTGGEGIVRLNRDGSIDPTFTANSMISNYNIAGIVPTVDGKVLIAGRISSFNGVEVGGIIRLDANGDFDYTFNSGSTLNKYIEEVAVQPDGKVLVLGGFTSFNGFSTPKGFVRLNESGSIDESFDNESIDTEFTNSPSKVSILEDGGILLLGLKRNENFIYEAKIIKLNTDGSIDNTFDPIVARLGGSATREMKMYPDGNIYLAGGVSGRGQIHRGGLLAVSPDRQLLEVNPDIGDNPNITNSILLPDGKVLIAGGFYEIDNKVIHQVARLNTDGSLDETFRIGIDLFTTNSSAYRLGIQSDGKIIVGGRFNGVGDLGVSSLIRLEVDGRLDSTFQPVYTDSDVMDIVIDENDDLLIGGVFKKVNGHEVNGFAKISKNGLFDSEFNSENALPGKPLVKKIKKTGNGELLVGGIDLNSYDGFVYKFSPTGDFISSFASKDQLHGASIELIEIVGDKVVFGGHYMTGGIEGRPVPFFQQNLDGTSMNDTSVLVAEKSSSEFFGSILPLSQDEVIFSGRFTKINDTYKSGLAKFRLDGTVDEDFTFNVDGSVSKIVREDEETALVFGYFSTINGQKRLGGARIKYKNDLPEISGVADSVYTMEETSVELQLSQLIVTDEDNIFPDDFSLSVFNGDDYVADDLIITPNVNFNGILNVAIKVNDGENDSPVYSLSIKVAPVNDAPVITGYDGTVTTTANTPLLIALESLSVIDPDNTFPDDFILEVEGGENYSIIGATITPALNFYGTLTIPVKVNDGEDDSPAHKLTIEVTPANDAPMIIGYGGTMTTNEDVPLMIRLESFSVTDPDNTFPDDFTLSIGAGNNYTVAGTTITPATDFNGTLTVPVKVNDSEADSPGYELSVAVTPINDVPVITAYTGTVVGNEDTPLTFSLDGISVTDPDNSFPADFSFSLEAGDNYTVDGASILPALNYSGSLSVAAKVSDGAANSAPYLIAVTIQAVNDAPVISGYSGTLSTLSTPEETALTIDLNSLTVTDPDNSFPGDFTLTILDGDNYTVADSEVTPAENFSGSINVPVTVSDGSDNSQAFNLTIEVAPVNDAPVITGYSGPLEMDENTLLSLALEDFTVADPDNEFPTEFTLNLNPGENSTTEGTTIVPDTNFSGELSVGVVVSDGTTLSQPFGLAITVNEITGILDLDGEISLFPIPVNNEITLRIDNNYQGVVMLNLTDLSGNSILTKRLTKKGQTFESVVDVRPVPRGLYIVEIEIPGKGIVSKRVVVE